MQSKAKPLLPPALPLYEVVELEVITITIEEV
jgi:hypothetical protein